MSTVPTRYSALRAGPMALLAASLSLALPGCFKNDGGTASDDSTSAATDATAPSTGATGGGSDDVGSTAAPTTDPPGTSGDDPPVTTTDAPTTADPTTGDDTSATVDCNSYCDLVMKNCSGDFSQYGAPETCLTSCAAFAPGSPGDMAGNSLACRLYHATAASLAPDPHCGHVKGDSPTCL